jgi:hypothetical protein
MKKVTLFLLILIPSVTLAQKSTYKGLPSLVWPTLYNITYQKEGDLDKPVFTKELLALSTTQVTLPGYMVPFENGMKGSHFMLSSMPLNACFFCGVGGPETVVEVFLTKPITYTDKPIEVKGKLILNNSDPDKMIYVLESADFLGAVEF